jgi:hypothetical protein
LHKSNIWIEFHSSLQTEWILCLSIVYCSPKFIIY